MSELDKATPEQIEYAKRYLEELGFFELCHVASAAQKVLEEMESEGYHTIYMIDLKQRLKELESKVDTDLPDNPA